MSTDSPQEKSGFHCFKTTSKCYCRFTNRGVVHTAHNSRYEAQPCAEPVNLTQYKYVANPMPLGIRTISQGILSGS